MIKINVVGRHGAEAVVDSEAGNTVMETVRYSGFDEMLALCGGLCACASCHIYVDEQWFDRLPVMSEDENDLLDGSVHRRPNSRLACQLVVGEALDGIRLSIAPED